MQDTSPRRCGRNRPRRRLPALSLRAGLAGLAALMLASGGSPAAAQPASTNWQVVGRQGILLHVIVPTAQSRELAAYQREIPLICGQSETCFVNFYTNTGGGAATLPLPDSISGEATAVLRRSAKQGVEGFRWSCRLALPEPDCF